MERSRLRFVPVYGVYRCHNCNWRGWLRRSNATHLRIGLVLAVYIVLGAAVITGTVIAVRTMWPSPEYEYAR